MIDNNCPTIKIGIGIMMKTSDMIIKSNTNNVLQTPPFHQHGSQAKEREHHGIKQASKQINKKMSKAKWYQSSR